MTQELKTCPFCGGEAAIESAMSDSAFMVYCINEDGLNVCDCAPETGYINGREAAIAAWNTRPSDSGLYEALKSALTAINAFWPKDAPENEQQASEDRVIAVVRKAARSALANYEAARAKEATSDAG